MGTQDAAVRELIERAIELSRSYAVWRTLVNKESFERHEKVISDYHDFFSATTHSLFQGFSVITYQLFERRKDTTSIPSIIDRFESTHPAQARQLKDAIAAQKPLLGKVFLIRNNVYAHRNRLKPLECFFSKAGLTAIEMESVVRFTQDTVAAIAEIAGVDTKAEIETDIQLRENCSRDDTRLIMETLQKHVL